MSTTATRSPLTLATSTPTGQQNVAIVNSTNATEQIQAPANAQGAIWFAFGLGSGSAVLNVNFNGQNYPNIPPGQYQLQGLTTPLGLTLTVANGSAKLTWVNS
jgi:hypothetical protein